MIIPLLTQLYGAGFPEPEVEVPVVEGRRWRWDLCWPDARIAVEQMGGIWTHGRHVRGKGYESDAEKLAEGQLQGYLVLFVTTDMIRDGRALALIQRAFAMRAKENSEL